MTLSSHEGSQEGKESDGELNMKLHQINENTEEMHFKYFGKQRKRENTNANTKNIVFY